MATLRLLAAFVTVVATVGAAPRDGARSGASREAWRLSGRLVSGDGRAFDYAVEFFRFGSARGPAIYPASLSIVDETRRVVFEGRRTERGSLGLAGAAGGRLAVHVGDWSLRESGSAARGPLFDLHVRVAGASLDVHGVARKPRVVFGKGDRAQVHYTSIASTGTLALDTSTFAVSGKSWLDHEFADDTMATAEARDARYRVQLDDGREILVETNGSERRAMLVERTGSAETLAPGQYEFGVDGGTTWRSTHTGATYPGLWALHVDGKTQFLSLEPVVIDQESTARGQGQPFWDGAVDVYDVTPTSQGRRLGSGYVLLTGFGATARKDAAVR